MRRYSFLLLLIFHSLDIQSQSQRINISGTRLTIDSLEGFSQGLGFLGLQKGEEAMINVMEIKGGNYYKNAATYKRERFEEKGIEVISFEETTLNGYDAKFSHVNAGQGMKGFQVVFGDSSFSVMVMANYIDASIETELKQALFSITYDKDKLIDPFANTSYRLDDTQTRLKFYQSNANLFIYSLDGKEAKTGEPSLIVMELPRDYMTSPQSMCERMIQGLEGKGLSDLQYVERIENPHEQYASYRILAKGTMGGNAIQIIIETVMGDKIQLVFQGIANPLKFDPILFRELMDTLELKEP